MVARLWKGSEEGRLEIHTEGTENYLLLEMNFKMRTQPKLIILIGLTIRNPSGPALFWRHWTRLKYQTCATLNCPNPNYRAGAGWPVHSLTLAVNEAGTQFLREKSVRIKPPCSLPLLCFPYTDRLRQGHCPFLRNVGESFSENRILPFKQRSTSKKSDPIYL